MNKIVEKIDAFMILGGFKREVGVVVISGIAVVLDFINEQYQLWTGFELSWIAIILSGLPIVIYATIGLITRFDIRSGLLVSIALIAATITGEVFAAGEIAFIMGLGELLEAFSVRRARAGIAKMVDLTPQIAHVLRDGEVVDKNASQVSLGEKIRILPGEVVPVDGTIIKGETSIDQSTMTGEPMPEDKSVGDEVFSGTINQYGTFEMEATKAGKDSSMQRMVSLVESADATKAKIVRIADKWATWIVIVAISVATVTLFVTGEIIRSVSVLVVFCPCALVLATPTAIVSAIGNATKYRFLVKEGDALERLATIDVIAFDKTGTLTKGKPQLVGASFRDIENEREVMNLVASLEVLSEHPIGKAISLYYTEKYSKKAVSEGLDCKLKEVSNFRIIQGKGLEGMVCGQKVVIGSSKILANEKMGEFQVKKLDVLCENARIKIFVVVDGNLQAILYLDDMLKSGGEELVKRLKEKKVCPVLITGDAKEPASKIAIQIGIDEVRAGIMPEKKGEIIDDIIADGHKVCMVGDGINDAIALKKANVSIAMGDVGSDIAIDKADIVLINDDISNIPHLLGLSVRMMQKIKFNLAISLIINFVAIGLAVVGILSPVLGALVHNGSAIVVILNSSLLLKYKSDK